MIADLLEKSGSRGAPVIREHTQRERKALPGIRAEIELAMPKVSSTPTKWRYDRAVALENGIERGVRELEEIAGALE